MRYDGRDELESNVTQPAATSMRQAESIHGGPNSGEIDKFVYESHTLSYRSRYFLLIVAGE